jgi:hypothetical protein
MKGRTIDDMGLFEQEHLRKTSLGSRWVIENLSELPAVMRFSQEVNRRQEFIEEEIRAIQRLMQRATDMVKLRFLPRDGPSKPGPDDLRKQFIADNALSFWVDILHEGQERSKEFKAFADYLFRLAGYSLTDSAVRAQLTAAIRRESIASAAKPSS